MNISDNKQNLEELKSKNNLEKADNKQNLEELKSKNNLKEDTSIPEENQTIKINIESNPLAKPKYNLNMVQSSDWEEVCEIFENDIENYYKPNRKISSQMIPDSEQIQIENTMNEPLLGSNFSDWNQLTNTDLQYDKIDLYEINEEVCVRNIVIQVDNSEIDAEALIKDLKFKTQAFEKFKENEKAIVFINLKNRKTFNLKTCHKLRNNCKLIGANLKFYSSKDNSNYERLVNKFKDFINSN
jgi:hypothetical protein